MKLSSLLENRTELLHLQQQLIDVLPDDIDVNMIEHPSLGPCLELVAGEKLLRMVRPVQDPKPGQKLIDVASHQNQHWSTFSYDGVVRLTARSSKLTESRSELLHLQQRLIDDLPDDVDVDLVHERILGDVICIGIWSNWSNGPTKRFAKPAPDGDVYYVPNPHVQWLRYLYDGLIEQLIEAAAANPRPQPKQ